MSFEDRGIKQDETNRLSTLSTKREGSAFRGIHVVVVTVTGVVHKVCCGDGDGFSR